MTPQVLTETWSRQTGQKLKFKPFYQGVLLVSLCLSIQLIWLVLVAASDLENVAGSGTVGGLYVQIKKNINK